MSIAAYKAVWKMELSGAKKLVMLAIADFANDQGEAWPSYDTLNEMTGTTTRHLKRVIKELSSEGHLSVSTHVGRGNSNHYKIPLKGDITSPIDTKEKVTFDALKGDIRGIKGDIRHLKGDITSPEPYRTVKNRKGSCKEPHKDLALATQKMIGYDKVVMTPNATSQLSDLTKFLVEAKATIKDVDYFGGTYWWGKTLPGPAQVKKYWSEAMAKRAGGTKQKTNNNGNSRGKQNEKSKASDAAEQQRRHLAEARKAIAEHKRAKV